MLTWVDHETCAVDGTEFLTMGEEADWAAKVYARAQTASTADRFVLFKSNDSINSYVALMESLAPQRIMELGIFRGGSTALFAGLVRPEKLVAIEWERERIAALDEYLVREGLTDNCRAYYGVDQADAHTINAIVEREFGNEPLDLVVDDASHFATQTRASFNTLFPRLRPGGTYLVEDWSWSLQQLPIDGEPMDEFVYELVRAAGRGPDLIADLEVRWDALTIQRGPAVLDGAFAVENWVSRVW